MADTAKDAVESIVDAVKNATIGESSSAGEQAGSTVNLVLDEVTGEKGQSDSKHILANANTLS
jgi:hypothetical protein